MRGLAARNIQARNDPSLETSSQSRSVGHRGEMAGFALVLW
jgi:hypothetical protein